MTAQSNDQRLDRCLAGLPLEVAPRRELFDAISKAAMPARTERAAPSRLALGAVAGFVLGVGFLWVSLGDHAAQASLGSLQASATVMAVRSEQVNAYRARLPLLDSATRVRVERDLSVIRQAESDLVDALKTTPDNAALARLYESTLRQEFDFYDTIVRATEPAMSGTTL